MAFPVSRHPVLDAPGGRLPVTNFIDGLLPEGSLRQQLAIVQRVAATDLMALLQARRCRLRRHLCGFAPRASRPAPHRTTVDPRGRSGSSKIYPPTACPEGSPAGVVVGGAQDKGVDRIRRRPVGCPGGAASTHIIKPESLRGTIPTSSTPRTGPRMPRRQRGCRLRPRIETFGARAAIVLDRYDRTDTGVRIHQEDCARRSGWRRRSTKYRDALRKQSWGSRLSQVIAVAAVRPRVDPTELRTACCCAVTYNIISGNGDVPPRTTRC